MTAPQDNWFEASIKVGCPVCNAKPGIPCREDATLRYVHLSRTLDAEAESA